MSADNTDLPLAEQAYQQLLGALREGELKPGSRVRENDVATMLGMSRTPVREALRRLESEGLIRSVAYRGMEVARLDYQEVMELYQMREVLEGTAAGLAARHASDAEIAALQSLLRTESGLDVDAAVLANHNRKLHTAICYAAHNRYLLRSLNSLSDALALLGETTMSVPGRTRLAHDEHSAIVTAIAERDPDAAEAAARTHIRAAQQVRLTLLNALHDEPTSLSDLGD